MLEVFWDLMTLVAAHDLTVKTIVEELERRGRVVKIAGKRGASGPPHVEPA